mgnify:CR=1 FL=1
MRGKKYGLTDCDDSPQSLMDIPFVGPKMAKSFYAIGIKSVSDLKGKNPEELYFRICEERGVPVDRCVLYVCRSAVYFAETEYPNPQKSKWWYWKDKERT